MIMSFYIDMKLVLTVSMFLLVSGFASLSQGCTVSEIRPWNGVEKVPESWQPANGKTLPVSDSAGFYYATRGEYGGDGHRAVTLPDITDSTGKATHIICVNGRLPSANQRQTFRAAIYKAMAEGSVCEVGSSMDYPEDVEVPENWLRQEGQTINRSEYPELYQHLGSELPSKKGSIICADGN